MDVPNWWEFLLLALAAFRVWKLLADDDILDRPRRWVTRLGSEWQQDGDRIPDVYRHRLGEFLMCPWCLGFHASWVLWLFWQLLPNGTLVVSTPLAISAAVGFLGSRVSS